GPVDIVVSDLSFISLKLVLLSLVAVCKPGAQLVLMIKPQFEIGRERLPKSGVVVNPQQRREAVMNVIEEALECGLTPRGVAASRLPGQDGNREYFFWASLKADGQRDMRSRMPHSVLIPNTWSGRMHFHLVIHTASSLITKSNRPTRFDH